MLLRVVMRWLLWLLMEGSLLVLHTAPAKWL